MGTDWRCGTGGTAPVGGCQRSSDIVTHFVTSEQSFGRALCRFGAVCDSISQPLTGSENWRFVTRELRASRRRERLKTPEKITRCAQYPGASSARCQRRAKPADALPELQTRWRRRLTSAPAADGCRLGMPRGWSAPGRRLGEGAHGPGDASERARQRRRGRSGPAGAAKQVAAPCKTHGSLPLGCSRPEKATHGSVGSRLAAGSFAVCIDGSSVPTK